MINQNKTTGKARYKTVYDNPHPPHPPRKHSELKKPDEILTKTKTLTTMARQKTAKEKAIQWTSQTGKEPHKNHSEKNRALHNAKRTKPLRRRVLIEYGLAKSSKKQHSKNTDKWHLCKAGSFSYGESPRTPPLEGTSLHRWNNSVERPWGILSLFTTCLPLCVKSPCHRLWIWHVDYPRKEHYKERNTKKWSTRTKPQEKLGTRRCMTTPILHPTLRTKHSELKEPDEILNETKSHSQTEDSQRKSPTMNQSNWKGTPQKPLWEEQSPTQC